MDSREKNVLVVVSANHFLAHFAMLFFPALVVPISGDISALDMSDVLALSFPGYLAFGITALPAGFLATRYKSKTLLAFGAGVVALGALGAGLMGDPQTLPYWLLMIGVGAGMYHPVGLALVSNTVRKRGKGHGIQGIFGNVGIAAAPFCAGALSYAVDWRFAYEVLGAVALLVMLVTLITQVNERTVEPSAYVQADIQTSMGRRVMLFATLSGTMVLAGFVYRGFHVLLPSHFVDGLFASQGLEGEVANFWATLCTSVVLAVAALGQLLGGRLADRMNLVSGLLLFHALSFPMLLGVSFIEGLFLPFFAGWFAFFNLGMQPFENSLVARYIPAQYRSIGYGVKFVLSFGVGSLAVLYAGQEGGGDTGEAFASFLPFLVGIVALTGVLGVLERAFERGTKT
jgi:MFS family permease